MASVIISLVLSFAGPAEEVTKAIRLAWLGGGVAVLWLLARSRLVDRGMSWVIEWALSRWTDLDTRDYVSLLRLAGDYRVNEMQVEEDDWLAGKNLRDCQLHDEGVIVLGILRADGTYVGAPRGGTSIYSGDTLLLYGRANTLQELDDRKSGINGDEAHTASVGEHEQDMAEQDRQDREQEARRQQREQQDGPVSRRPRQTVQE